jgi:hypothetical protein
MDTISSPLRTVVIVAAIACHRKVDKFRAVMHGMQAPFWERITPYISSMLIEEQEIPMQAMSSTV